MPQIASFWLSPGKSTKNTLSNYSARANSGGNFKALLHVPTKKTSLSWSFSHVSSEPNTRAVTPESVWPELVAPASAFRGRLLTVPLPGVSRLHPRRSNPFEKSRNRIEVGPV